MYKPFRTGIWILTTLSLAALVGVLYTFGFSDKQNYFGFGIYLSSLSITLSSILATGVLLVILLIMEKVYASGTNTESIYLLKEYLDKALKWQVELSDKMRKMEKMDKTDEDKVLKSLAILERCYARMSELMDAFPRDNMQLVCMELTADLANIRTYLESTRENDKLGEQPVIPINSTVKDGNYNYIVKFFEDKTLPSVYKFSKSIFGINYLFKEEIKEILVNVIAQDIKEFIQKDKKLQVTLDSYMTEIRNEEGHLDDYYVNAPTLRRKFMEALNLDTTVHLLEYILNSDVIEGNSLRTTEYLTKNSTSYTKATVANTWTLIPYVGKNDVRLYLRGKVIDEVFGEGICYIISLEGVKNA